MVMLAASGEALNARKNRVLLFAQAALPEAQYQTFRKLFLGEFGRDGLERELVNRARSLLLACPDLYQIASPRPVKPLGAIQSLFAPSRPHAARENIWHCYISLERSTMDSAKVFMTGRSQAVRLPKAYWFNTEEVLIERQSDGALLLRPKQRPRLGERLRAILRTAPVDPAFLRPQQPRLERDARWWAKHGFCAATPRKRRTKR